MTRRLYRSGESEYLINGRPCRLRDITELFLGTGVGTKAYSIVEQGRVGQIVGAKPEELRLFIEEAAGTTLYRSRKLAAERKIERTRDNLLRVSDIVRELERQAELAAPPGPRCGAVPGAARAGGRPRPRVDRAAPARRRRAAARGDRGRGRSRAVASTRCASRSPRGQQQRDALRERGRDTESARETARQALFAARADDGADRAGTAAPGRSGAASWKRCSASPATDLCAASTSASRSCRAKPTRPGAAATELAARYEQPRRACAGRGRARSRVRRALFRVVGARPTRCARDSIEALGASAALRNERASVARQIEAAEARETRLRFGGRVARRP